MYLKNQNVKIMLSIYFLLKQHYIDTTIKCRGFSSRHSKAEEEDFDLSLKIKMYHLDLLAGFHYRSTEKVRGPNQEYHGINI